VTPGWVVLGLVIAVFTATCIWLGLWQVDRGRERAAENEVLASRLARDPIPLDALLVDDVPLEEGDLVGWPVTVTGTYLADDQVLIRGRALDGRPGSWVLAPLATSGETVAVNRGWVPLEVTAPDDPRIAPPGGTVTIEGITAAGETAGRFTPELPAGETEIYNIVDLERLGDQVGAALAPVVVQAVGTEPPPEVLPAPDVDDPGPHAAYAVQWFGFALVAVGGFFALAGRQLGRGPLARFGRGR
jgi:cytochrome oxidase assembly protein ShyY1